MRVLCLQCPHYSPQPPQNCCAIGSEHFPMQRSLLSVPACQRQHIVWRREYLQTAVLLHWESGPRLNLRRAWISEPRLQPCNPARPPHLLSSEIRIHNEAQRCKINAARERRLSKEKPNLKLGCPWRINPQLLLFHMSKGWPYSTVYLPQTMINQLKYYSKWRSGWETVNFLQASLEFRHITIFPMGVGRADNFLCVCAHVFVFSVPWQQKLYRETLKIPQFWLTVSLKIYLPGRILP